MWQAARGRKIASGGLQYCVSTQNVSGTDDGFANSLGVTADNVDVT